MAKIGITMRFLLIALCLAAALCSCSKKEESAAVLDLRNLVGLIGEKIDLSETVERLEQYQNDCGISADEIVWMTALKKIDVSNVGNAEVLLFVETADADKAKEIETKLKTYKTNKLNELSNYNINPDYERQWYIVDKSEIIVEGKYVFWAVDEKDSEINAIIRDYIKSNK
ncbi:MAG: DUF4358 domain-containing protein [Oscillospiraceae bacterium]|nr:DUF4358 domain-containing protein [Oscillospiraceae bacterium]